MRQISKLVIALSFITILGCKPPVVISEQNYKEKNFVVATADNDYSLSMDELYSKLYSSRLLQSGGVLDTSFVRHFADSLILDTLIGLEANSQDISSSYGKYRLFKIRYYDILIKQFFQKMVYDKVHPDSLEVVDYYYANKEMFSIEEQVNLYHILLNENNLFRSKDSVFYRSLEHDALMGEVKKLADSVSGLITSAENFPEIARQYSDDPSAKTNGGYVGWTKRKVYRPPFDSIAFSLKVGDVSAPYKDEDGWHIIMIDNYYPAGFQPLNEDLYKAAYNTFKTSEVNRIGIQFHIIIRHQ